MGFDELTQVFLILIFCTARIGVALIVAPFFGPQFVQGLARNIIIFNLALLMVPVVQESYPTDPINMIDFGMIILKEGLIGFFIGFIVSIAFSVAEGVGAAIDFQRGSSIAQAFDPTSGDTTSVLGALFIKAAVLVFFMAGGLFLFLAFLYKTFELWPIFSYYPTFHASLPEFTLELIDKMMQGIVLLSAPVLFILFLSEFGLGMMNRFAPQLNVFSISLAVKSGVAAILFVFYTSILFSLFKKEILKGQEALELFTKLL